MPLQLQEGNNGRFLTIRATGRLVEEDYKSFVPQFEGMSPHNGKLHILFDITRLHGWDAEAAWEDIKFDVKHYPRPGRTSHSGPRRSQSSSSRQRQRGAKAYDDRPTINNSCGRLRIAAFSAVKANHASYGFTTLARNSPKSLRLRVTVVRS